MSEQKSLTRTGFDVAVAAVVAGTAKAHSLWVILSKESERNGYALKPMPWEGSGEYQHVSFDDGRDGFVRIPSMHYSIDETAKRRVRLSKLSKATGAAS